MGVKNNGSTTKKGIKNEQASTSSKLQISESPSGQSEANCFFGIKSYIRDFYQKYDSDQESVIGIKDKKANNRYSSSESDTESEEDDRELKNYKNIIKNCDKIKKKLKGKSRRKIRKFINYSRDHWNLFNTNDSDDGSSNAYTNKKLIDEERQEYKSNSGKRWSVYVWRSIFIIGCVLLITGLLMASSFLYSERQVEIGRQEEMEIIDSEAIRFNQVLNQVRAFSLALISIGLLLFLSTLLLPTLVGVSLNCFNFGKKKKDQTFESFFNQDKSDSESETCSKVYVKSDKKKGARKARCKKGIEQPIEDNISKIPTFEQIQTVQPEREKEQVFLWEK